jgi:DmsE family decaheme c-type cytochrome
VGPARAQDEPTYMGDAVCAACHESLIADYSSTAHAKVFTPVNARTALMRQGCEACHGPGSGHVSAGGGKATEGMLHLRGDGSEDALAQNAVCLQCHDGAERTYWQLSAHDSADVSCTSCHTVMKAVSHEDLLSKKNETDTCSQCHLMPRSQMFRNAHMPLRPTEEKMSCSSCHNPHGTIADRLIRDHTINDTCYRCHAEKRGPFLWEHPPVYENCLNCHNPHGSTREAMLQHSVPRLCQLCHPTGHAGSPRDPDHRFVIGTSCLQCHTNIHGSNHPSGQRFVR